MSSPYYGQRDWTGSVLRVVTLQDSVKVRAHGVPVFVFEYLDYDVATQSAQESLEALFYQYFTASLAEKSRLKIIGPDPMFAVPDLHEQELLAHDGSALTVMLPNGNGADLAIDRRKADFLLFVQGLSFDVREQYFSGRNRKAYLRLNCYFVIWDNLQNQAAIFGAVNLSERASFQVKRGTFEPTFSEKTWAKTISKVAAMVLKDTPFER